MKFRPNTDQHDFDFKLRNVHRFLENGDKAKVVIFFKGREIVHREFGMRVLQRVAEATEEDAVIEQQAKQEGRTLVMILAPKNSKTKKGGSVKAQAVIEHAVAPAKVDPEQTAVPAPEPKQE